MCNLGEFQACSRSHTPITHKSTAWHFSRRIANSSELGTVFTNPLPALLAGQKRSDACGSACVPCRGDHIIRTNKTQRFFYTASTSFSHLKPHESESSLPLIDTLTFKMLPLMSLLLRIINYALKQINQQIK